MLFSIMYKLTTMDGDKRLRLKDFITITKSLCSCWMNSISNTRWLVQKPTTCMMRCTTTKLLKCRRNSSNSRCSRTTTERMMSRTTRICKAFTLMDLLIEFGMTTTNDSKVLKEEYV